jgi:hypothetical protein
MHNTDQALKLFQKSTKPLCAADISQLAGRDRSFGRDTVKQLMRNGRIKRVSGSGTRNDPGYFVAVQPELPVVPVTPAEPMTDEGRDPFREPLTVKEQKCLLGGDKIQAIKLVRERTGLPLKESLEIVNAWSAKQPAVGSTPPAALQPAIPPQLKIRWLLDGVDLGAITVEDALSRIRGIVG